MKKFCTSLSCTQTPTAQKHCSSQKQTTILFSCSKPFCPKVLKQKHLRFKIVQFCTSKETAWNCLSQQPQKAGFCRQFFHGTTDSSCCLQGNFSSLSKCSTFCEIDQSFSINQYWAKHVISNISLSHIFTKRKIPLQEKKCFKEIYFFNVKSTARFSYKLTSPLK